MWVVNWNALFKYPGLVYVGTYSASIPTLLQDMTNAKTVTDYIDANITFNRLASVVDVQTSQNFGADLIEVETDDNWTIYKAARPEVHITWTWMEAGDLTTLNKITGQNILSVAWTPTAVTWEAIGTTVAAGTIYTLVNKDWDNTQVASIVVSDTWGALVLNTDYTVWVNAAWYTYLVFLLATTWATTVDYSYTPSATKFIGTNIKTLELPRLVMKIVSTDDSGKTNTEYLIDAGFEWELIKAFVDVARAGDIPGTSFDFKGNKLGAYVSKNERF